MAMSNFHKPLFKSVSITAKTIIRKSTPVKLSSCTSCKCPVNYSFGMVTVLSNKTVKKIRKANMNLSETHLYYIK